LAKPSQDVPPATYRSVDPKLFERILDETMAGSGKASVGGAWHAPPHQAGG
jgi:COX Aromatic Rich Motif